jgi:hypothetical protein
LFAYSGLSLRTTLTPARPTIRDGTQGSLLHNRAHCEVIFSSRHDFAVRFRAENRSSSEYRSKSPISKIDFSAQVLASVHSADCGDGPYN